MVFLVCTRAALWEVVENVLLPTRGVMGPGQQPTMIRTVLSSSTLTWYSTEDASDVVLFIGPPSLMNKRYL